MNIGIAFFENYSLLIDYREKTSGGFNVSMSSKNNFIDIDINNIPGSNCEAINTISLVPLKEDEIENIAMYLKRDIGLSINYFQSIRKAENDNDIIVFIVYILYNVLYTSILIYDKSYNNLGRLQVDDTKYDINKINNFINGTPNNSLVFTTEEIYSTIDCFKKGKTYTLKSNKSST